MNYWLLLLQTVNPSLLIIKRSLFDELLLNPWFFVGLAFVLLFERVRPVSVRQSTFSRGLKRDVVWMFFTLVVSYTVVLPLAFLVLRHVYNSYLGFLTITAVSNWPWLGKFFLALLWGDFVFWAGHLIRHKVQLFWRFHAIHHSQKHLNFFTEYRKHPLDDVIIYILLFIPTFMVSDSFVIVASIAAIREWHTRFYHSNFRTNLGPLKYILVTPQSHRVHHSVEERHRDKNFGLTFSIWDHLFGTQYRNYDEYPQTGVADPDFPCELQSNRNPFLTILDQLIHPFKIQKTKVIEATPNQKQLVHTTRHSTGRADSI